MKGPAEATTNYGQHERVATFSSESLFYSVKSIAWVKVPAEATTNSGQHERVAKLTAEAVRAAQSKAWARPSNEHYDQHEQGRKIRHAAVQSASTTV